MALSLVAAALLAPTSNAHAQEKPKAEAPSQAAPTTPKNSRLPFHGNVAAVDSAAMTLTVGTLILNVTSETTISKAGKPATLAEITVGDKVGGSYKKDAAGKLNAVIIRASDKTPKPEKNKKKAEPAAAK